MEQNQVLYYKCNMTKGQHIGAYVVCALIMSVLLFLFYHMILISCMIGFISGFFLEKLYAQSTVTRRQKAFRLQFRNFLDSMSVAVRAGNVEYGAVKFALDDLKMTYSDDADIVKEVAYILQQYEKGGIRLTDLFENLAERTDLQDVKNFASVYAVIEGRSDRFGDVLVETKDIISDKIDIEQQIDAAITSAKTETYTMMAMPVVIVIALSVLGGGMMSALFTTAVGHVAVTVALALFAVAFVIAMRVSSIEV